MKELMDRLGALGLRRLLALAGTVLAIAGFMVFAAGQVMKPAMGLLYSDLELADSARIADQLDQMGVAHDLSRDGTRILVPEDQVARLRLTLAESGLPSGGSLGYEIFDRTDALGTTSFVQNINRLRALEGEIARSIRAIAQIAAARVHLVLPERQVFARDSEAPSASVMLKLRAGALSAAQVAAIQQLTAAAVSGLSPDKVAIVDDRGTLLGGGTGAAQNPGEAAAHKTREYEQRMRQSLEQLVGATVGYDKVRAEVTARIDYAKVTVATETFDPDSQVVRSTQSVTDKSHNQDATAPVTVGSNLPQGQGAQGGTQTSTGDRSEETTNYELSRTQQTEIREGGKVERLSVALLVDGTYAIQPDGSRSYQPRTADELASIGTLVKSAIGFDESRGDQVRVVNLPFADAMAATAEIPSDASFLDLTKADYFKIAELAALALLGALLILFVLRPLLGRMLHAGPAVAMAGGGVARLASSPAPGRLAGPDSQTPLLAPAGAPSGHDSELEQMVDIANIEGRVKASSLKRVGEIVSQHPEEAIAIMRNWMYHES